MKKEENQEENQEERDQLNDDLAWANNQTARYQEHISSKLANVISEDPVGFWKQAYVTAIGNNMRISDYLELEGI